MSQYPVDSIKKSPPRISLEADKTNHNHNSTILERCQYESHKSTKVDKSKRVRLILSAMGESALTAREIVERIGFSDMNTVRPRLTEMVASGLVEVIGVKYDKKTRRTVSVFRGVI